MKILFLILALAVHPTMSFAETTQKVSLSDMIENILVATERVQAISATTTDLELVKDLRLAAQNAIQQFESTHDEDWKVREAKTAFDAATVRFVELMPANLEQDAKLILELNAADSVHTVLQCFIDECTPALQSVDSELFIDLSRQLEKAINARYLSIYDRNPEQYEAMRDLFEKEREAFQLRLFALELHAYYRGH